ncbi:histidinol-phosphate transaminase [Chytridiales sp. JEL 0842]|nr:histidinol-phosphate transaminase [Chytridiales sp. JEL 0842]
MVFELERAVRPNILALKAYRCARDDYSTGILLDANENSFGPAVKSGSIIKVPADASYTDTHLERYPDPYQKEIKDLLASYRGLPSAAHFFLGVGSDESIDIIIRVFCVPSQDKILICPPTYGMYSVCAQINDAGIVKVPLNVENGAFSLNVPNVTILENPSIKVIFLCSPGNPTGTMLSHADIKEILEFESYKGVVVVDEAYIDFCADGSSTAPWVLNHPNLIVIQTLSKSFGLAGIRLGIAISSPEIADIFNKTKAPYNISTTTSLIARSALSPDGISTMKAHITMIKNERVKLIEELNKIGRVGKILGGNDANFVVAQFVDANGQPDNDLAFKLYKNLAESEGVVVRFRGTEIGCEGCLRITVGTVEENKELLKRIHKSLALFQ